MDSGIFLVYVSPNAENGASGIFFGGVKMKRKLLSLLLVLLSLFCLFSCGGGNATCALLEKTETRVVISVSGASDNGTVMDCMEFLQAKGEISYKLSGTMVTELNGKANAADFSGCWMLYTSDAEMSNAEWGTVEYEGKTLGSAILGAEALTVTAGEIYIWEYVIF